MSDRDEYPCGPLPAKDTPIPSAADEITAREVRALPTARRAIRKAMLDLEQSLRRVPRSFGLKLGKIGKGGSDARVRELAAGNPMLETMSQAMLRSRAGLRGELAGLECRLRDPPKEDADCRLTMTMPGTGPGMGALVALTRESAIDDPTRFRCSKDVGPWAGLTPGRR